MVFAAVLVALAIGLFFLLNWILGSGGPPGASSPPTPAPSPAPGQLPAPAPISSPPPFVVASPSPSPGAAQGRIHQVQAGDTLNRIAQSYGVTVDAIMQANGRADRNQILRIGERLVIPDAPAGGTAPR
jgi:LysM repeat protein